MSEMSGAFGDCKEGRIKCQVRGKTSASEEYNIWSV